ncbi:TON1 Recruiting Motif 15 [Hibiscus trionum]|uniref:TON1 Recruiting Motif 15 n=1 Tax=Hibiscus trionum TaxID=183268 RepID=A0A9W7H9K9_HIBTR|nr:TON1 Recruiting Motif 15 [Hibiscus trionum]
MAKRSSRRAVRNEKEQLGCMWGLISMFDFRLGRSTQRLLSDRRRGNKYAGGVGNSGNNLDMMTRSGDKCSSTHDSEEKTKAINACKLSVKKLLEEEMSGKQAVKKEVNNSDVEAKQFDSVQGHNGRKNRKRKNKYRKKSSGNSLDMDAAENLLSEVSCQDKSEQQQTTSNLDMDGLMKEFCRQIHRKRMNCVNHDQLAEANMQSNPKSSGLEERLSEAIKFLVSQKLVDRNQIIEDGELQASKEVMDALRILSLDEELFLKLLRDPNSLLVKYVQNMPDSQLKDEESKLLAPSNYSENEPDCLRQSNEPVNRKQRNFFRRKLKSQERDMSNEKSVSEASSKIVILKPGPITPETGSSLGTSPESQYVVRHREPNEKVGSRFLLAELKRKWKHAMGREQQRLPTDRISGRLSGERQNSVTSEGVKEYIGMNSPTKDHFFIERIGRSSIGVKKGEKTSKLKGSELGTEYETTDFSRHSNIYIEAKKHLSEMITNGEESVDLSRRRVSKSLGRILSLPEYNSSPFGSPGRNSESSFVTAQMRFSGSDKFLNVNENDRQNYVSHLSQVAEEHESQLGVPDIKTSDEVQGDNGISNNIDTCLIDDCSTKDEMNSKGGVNIVEDTKIMVQEESKLSDASSETSDPSITRDDKNADMPEDSSEEDQQPFSPLESPSTSSVARKVDGLESVNDTQERPSPVSVLDLIFTEDVFSPTSIRSRSGETSIQPIRIRFEEHGSIATNQSNRIKTCMDDKELIFEHIKAVLQPSTFNWDELYIRSLSSELLLDPLLLDEVEYFPNQLCPDQKLLFDCINEILMEVCEYYFGSLGVSFVKPNIRPIPNTKDTIQEVWQGVYWHLLPMPQPRTLDQIVRKDMAKTGTWMDLRLETDCIGIEMGDTILEDLVEDTITSYIIETLEAEYDAEELQD